MSLDLLGWGQISDFLKDVINRVVPDPTQKAQAALALAQLEQQGDFKEIDAQLALVKSQTDINLTEASSTSLFVAGWRPYIGWVCGIALTYQYLLRPLLPWIINLFHPAIPVELPMKLDDTLTQLVYGMLGFGALRTIDKAVPHITGIFSK